MAVKVKYRFATAMDTADRLGVPRSRAAKLIKLVDSLNRTEKKNGPKTTGSLKRKTSKRQTRAKVSKAAR